MKHLQSMALILLLFSLWSCSELPSVIKGESQMNLYDNRGRAVDISMHITDEDSETLKGYFVVDATFVAETCVEDAIRVPFDIKKQMSSRDRAAKFAGDEIEFKCNQTHDERIDRIIVDLSINQGFYTEATSPTDRDKKVPAYTMQWLAYSIKRVSMSGIESTRSNRLERSAFKEVQ